MSDDGVADHRAKQAQADRDGYYSRREVPGPTYQIEPPRPYDDRHAGDPMRQIILAEPPVYDHPEPLGPDVLDPGGPRILPVNQSVSYGPQESREAEFAQGQQDPLKGPPYFLEDFDDQFEHDIRGIAHDRALYDAYAGFVDRRQEGRRHRPIDNVTELLGQQRPYPPAPAPADLPLDRFLRGW
jgi:hypothetical protein